VDGVISTILQAHADQRPAVLDEMLLRVRLVDVFAKVVDATAIESWTIAAGDSLDQADRPCISGAEGSQNGVKFTLCELKLITYFVHNLFF
jgi:hypothetical protein